jgi:peptide/nickel transport system ATP-binding protein
VSSLLEVQHLSVEYRGSGLRPKRFRALSDVSIAVAAGRTVGVVGESGSGKTTLGRAILGLAPVTEGTITFDGRDITAADRTLRRRLSSDLQVVFQDPYGSLNPVLEVGDILTEPLTASGMPSSEAARHIGSLLHRVGLPADAAHRYPRNFSGGQRQRIAIARALALGPKLIICDEPVSALDLTTQARVVDLLLEIQRETGVAFLFISHDLDVVRHVSHEIAVMYRGEIVEHGPALQVADSPSHPYTERLRLASPVPDPDQQAERRAARERIAALGSAW